MKKIQKKLVLKKKTIAQLNDQAISNKKLNQVQGGKTTICSIQVCTILYTAKCTNTCHTYCADSQGNWC